MSAMSHTLVNSNRCPQVAILEIPSFARDDWRLDESARLREPVVAVRKDEAGHFVCAAGRDLRVHLLRGRRGHALHKRRARHPRERRDGERPLHGARAWRIRRRLPHSLPPLNNEGITLNTPLLTVDNLRDMPSADGQAIADTVGKLFSSCAGCAA